MQIVYSGVVIMDLSNVRDIHQCGERITNISSRDELITELLDPTSLLFGTDVAKALMETDNIDLKVTLDFLLFEYVFRALRDHYHGRRLSPKRREEASESSQGVERIVAAPSIGPKQRGRKTSAIRNAFTRVTEEPQIIDELALECKVSSHVLRQSRRFLDDDELSKWRYVTQKSGGVVWIWKELISV